MSDKKKEKQDVAETQKLSTKENILQTVKFALFSASAGIIQITTYTLFFEVCHFKEWVAYLISLVLSVLWNFTFNRKFTFKSANNVPIAMLKVAAYYCVFTPLSTWYKVRHNRPFMEQLPRRGHLYADELRHRIPV